MLLFLVLLILFSSASLIGDRGTAAEYNPRFSFNKTLDAKMKYYPYRQKMGWLKGYMNIFLPLYVLYIAYLLAQSIYNAYPIPPDTFRINLYMVVLAVQAIIISLNAVFFRELNKFSYRFNTAANFFILGCQIIPGIVSVLIDIFTGRDPDMVVFFAISVLFSSVFFGGVILGNIFYFRARKELFMLTARELKSAYGSLVED